MTKHTLATLAICALLTAACSGGETVEKVDTGSTASTSPAGSAETDFVVGDTVKTAAGNTVSVDTVEDWKSSNQFSQPDSGNRFVAAEVHACASQNNDGAVAINPFDFALQMSDDSRAENALVPREPALHHTELLPGDCVRGWVVWQAPKSLKPTAVAFVGASIVRWRVP